MQLKERYHHVITHLHPRASDAYRAFRSASEVRLKDIVQKKAPIDADTLTALRTFPEIAYVLAAGLLQHEGFTATLKDNSEVLLHVLMAEYSLAAEKLEGYVLGEGQGEIIYRLLSWSKNKNRKLLHPTEYYEDWLARDPFWAGQWMKVSGSASLAEKVALFAQTSRKEDAGAAFAWLSMHKDEPMKEYQSAILGNPFYTLVSILNLPTHPDTSLMLTETLTPRWAYHLALVETSIPKATLEDVLLSDLGWLVEYFVDANISEEDPLHVSKLYRETFDRLVASGTVHACSRAFHAWVTRLTAHHKAKYAAKNKETAQASA